MEQNNQPMRKYDHVLARQTFEEIGDGTVRVTDDQGRSGIFRWTGEYLEGDITQCSLHMLRWTGGPTVPKEYNYRWTEIPADISRPSGWPEHLERHLER